ELARPPTIPFLNLQLEGIPATHVPLDVIKENLHGTGSPNRSEVGAVACVCSFLAG
ncbi:hypothetical protein PF002_g30071, partial [Phytophthora fragariae]